jgi:hypothetical protein
MDVHYKDWTIRPHPGVTDDGRAFTAHAAIGRGEGASRRVVHPDFSDAGRFTTVDDAKSAALQRARDWIDAQERQRAGQ